MLMYFFLFAAGAVISNARDLVMSVHLAVACVHFVASKANPGTLNKEFGMGIRERSRTKVKPASLLLLIILWLIQLQRSAASLTFNGICVSEYSQCSSSCLHLEKEQQFTKSIYVASPRAAEKEQNDTEELLALICRRVNADNNEVRVVNNRHLLPFILTTLNHADLLKCVQP